MAKPKITKQGKVSQQGANTKIGKQGFQNREDGRDGPTAAKDAQVEGLKEAFLEYLHPPVSPFDANFAAFKAQVEQERLDAQPTEEEAHLAYLVRLKAKTPSPESVVNVVNARKNVEMADYEEKWRREILKRTATGLEEKYRTDIESIKNNVILGDRASFDAMIVRLEQTNAEYSTQTENLEADNKKARREYGQNKEILEGKVRRARSESAASAYAFDEYIVWKYYSKKTGDSAAIPDWEFGDIRLDD